MRRFFLIAFLAQSLSMPVFLCARLQVPPGEEDLRDLAQHAPLVFRGKVAEVNLARDQAVGKEGIAIIAVDRWYRGTVTLRGLSRVQIHFMYGPATFSQGHNCVDLVPNSHWLFFAQPGKGAVLELFHDCEGALTISALLATHPAPDFLSDRKSTRLNSSHSSISYAVFC